MWLRHLPFCFCSAPSTYLFTKRGFFRSATPAFASVGCLRFFGDAGRASNDPRNCAVAGGSVAGSLIRSETCGGRRPNAFAASFCEPNHRHALSPTRRISSGFCPWGLPASLRAAGAGAGGATRRAARARSWRGAAAAEAAAATLASYSSRLFVLCGAASSSSGSAASTEASGASPGKLSGPPRVAS